VSFQGVGIEKETCEVLWEVFGHAHQPFLNIPVPMRSKKRKNVILNVN